MPHISKQQKLLNALLQAREELDVQIYVQMLLDAINAESQAASSTCSTDSSHSSHISSSTSDSHSEITQSRSYSSDNGFTILESGSFSSSDDVPGIFINLYELIAA